MSENQIPTTWEECILSDLGDISSGGTPSTKNPEFWGDEIPWISPSDLTGYTAKYISKGAKSLSKKGLLKSSAKLMPAGSVHFSSRAPIGYLAISSQSLCTNQGFKSLTPAEGIFNEYIYYYLKSIKDLANSLATGTTFKELSGKAFAKLPFPLPPLAEQHRIVAKIEELFSELDAGEESLRRARQQLGTYRQSLLKQAFEGKLTEQWRKQNPDLIESPEQLLKNIQAERQERYEQKLNDWELNYDAWENGVAGEKRPAKPRKPKDTYLQHDNQTNYLPDLPLGWSWIAMENCALEISDGPFGSNLKSSDYVGSGVRVVRLENIGAGEFIEDKESFISHEKYKILKRHTVRPGDIVVASFINDAVRAALVPLSIVYAVNKADCFQVNCYGKSLSAQFLLRCLGSRYFFKQLEQLVHGVGRPRINTTQLGESFIPLCSLPEQREIVRLLDEQFTVIAQNEQEIDAALKRSTALRQSILKKAFTGQLVPQDANDEPAALLLERIKNERVVFKTKPNKRTTNGK